MNSWRFDPVTRHGTVSDTIFTRLVDEILRGRWPADGPVAVGDLLQADG